MLAVRTMFVKIIYKGLSLVVRKAKPFTIEFSSKTRYCSHVIPNHKDDSPGPGHVGSMAQSKRADLGRGFILHEPEPSEIPEGSGGPAILPFYLFYFFFTRC